MLTLFSPNRLYQGTDYSSAEQQWLQMQQMQAVQQEQREHEKWRMVGIANRARNAVKPEPIKPKKRKTYMPAKKFFMVVDADGNTMTPDDYGRRKRFTDADESKALADAQEFAEKLARANEDDYFIVAAIKVVGAPKAPVEVIDL